MATAVGGARDALARALRELASVALDEDEIEYVLDGAIDVDGTCAPREEFVEFVWPVIAPWVDDDEARARTLAGDARDGVDAAGTTTVEETRRVDRAPVCLGEGWREGVEREDAARRATAAAAGVAKMFVGKDGRGDAVESRVGMRDREKARRAGERLAASAADERREMVANLTAARERAARARVEGRARALSNVELGPFAVPNPGGGADLIEDASVTLVPGRRYGLIGRNGKGKSTLLKFLAARRVEGIDESYSVHYVTQEVELTAEEERYAPRRRGFARRPAAVVASGGADEIRIERRRARGGAFARGQRHARRHRVGERSRARQRAAEKSRVFRRSHREADESAQRGMASAHGARGGFVRAA